MKEQNKPFVKGDIVPYFNSQQNIKLAEIVDFRTDDTWFMGIDIVTHAEVYYPVHKAQQIQAYADSRPDPSPTKEGEKKGDDKWNGHDRESLLWHLAMRDINIEKLEYQIQTLREDLDGYRISNQNIVDQNCSLLDERDRSNASFKKMNDLFDLKIKEAEDYKNLLLQIMSDVTEENWDHRIRRVLAKYPSITTNTTEK
jgi:hypothetical protein